MKIANLVIQGIESQPFNENTYIVHRDGQADCVVFDPGFEPDKILAHLDQHQLNPVAIYNTHGHSDHIAGNAALKQRWPDIPLLIGRGDADKLTDPQKNLSAPFGVALTSPSADLLVDEGDAPSHAGITFRVLETPGHSCGHVVFVCGDGPEVILGGDVLFNGSVGRTDFPDSDPQALIDSIHQKLFPLPGDTIVLPGHGPATTIADEIERNPFVGRPAGYSAG